MPDTTTEPVVDATVVPEGVESHHLEPDALQPTSTAVALAPPGAGAIISADQPQEILAKAAQIATPLKALIEQAGLAKHLGGSRKHVEVGGWQAAGTMLGALGGQALHAETVWTRRIEPAVKYTATVKRYHRRDQGGGLREEVTYDVDGFSWEACVEVKTASGTVIGRAEAMCGRDEETWNDRSDYAVRSMAETRAESRAYRRAIGWIMHLAGYNPTPAEEMGHTPGADTPTSAPLPWWAEAASDERKKDALDVTAGLLGGDRDTARDLLKNVAGSLGLMPDVIPAFVKALGATVDAMRAAPAPASEHPAETLEPQGDDPDDTAPTDPGAMA